MKMFRKVWCALLSLVMATSMTSCLDSGDSTVYLNGTGTVTSSSTIRLDNGLTLKTSDLTLTYGSRVYIYAGVDETDYNNAVSSINSGSSTAAISLTSIYTAGECQYLYANDATDDFETELEDRICTPINSISWLSFGAFGNGYMQFVINTDYYLKSSDSSYSLVTPDIRCLIKTADSENVELVLVMNNKKASCTDSEGKVLSGYTAYTGGDIPVSVNVSDLYYTLKDLGLTDTDYVSLSVKFVDSANYNINESGALTGKLGTSTNYFTVGSLKNVY